MTAPEPTPAETQSGGMIRIKANYCVDEGEYEFETESDRDEFISNPTFSFDFNIDNVDDKEGVERIFGTLDVAPHFSNHSPEFAVTRVEPSEDNETVAIVSVEVEMFFDIRISLADFLEWVESEGDTWRYSGRIECAGEMGLINSAREDYVSFLEVTSILEPLNSATAFDIVQSIKEQLAGAIGLTIFVPEDTDGELVDSLLCNLEGDGALLIQVEIGASYMDYIAPLMETEDGDTVILDGVQNVDESLIEDFLRIISDRVLVGTVGEGEDAQLFEMPMSAFNLVLIDRGGGETYLIRNACDDQLAIDVFARGINPSATALETSDGDVLSLLSAFVNQCAPDSGWFDGDGQSTFVMPDGTTVLATQSEYEDVGEWIETYDEMTVKHITEYNGIEFSDEEVDEYLQESGGLFHFKFEIEMLGGHAIYEFVQFGEGEIAAESSEVIGIDGGEIFSWTQNAIAEAWQAAP